MSLTEKIKNWRIERGIKKKPRSGSLYKSIRGQGYSGNDLSTLLLIARNMESLFAFRSTDDAKLVGEYFGRAMDLSFTPNEEGDKSKRYDFSGKLSMFGMHDRYPDYLERVKEGSISQASYEQIVDEMSSYKMIYLINFEFGNQYTGNDLDTMIVLSNMLEDGFVFRSSGCSGETPDKLSRSVHYARRIMETSDDNLVLLSQLDILKHDWNMSQITGEDNLLDELSEKYFEDPHRLTQIALFGFLSEVETLEQYDRGLELLHQARDSYLGITSDAVDLTVRAKEQSAIEDSDYLFCLENLARFELKRSRIFAKEDRRWEFPGYGTDFRYNGSGGRRFSNFWEARMPRGNDGNQYHADSRGQNPDYQDHFESAKTLFEELYNHAQDRSRIPEDLWGEIFEDFRSSTFAGDSSTSFRYDPFEVLGVDRNVGFDEAKKAYRKRALETHPDKFGDDKLKEEEFKKVHQAWQDVQDHYKRN